MSHILPYDRIIVLALDSVCWELLLPFAQDATMPALAAFLRKAHYGVLESTVPPHTAAAWTSFLTGKDPGRHGVIDFVAFDPTTHRFRFHNSSTHHADSIFTQLSAANISCGSIFLPRNYPPMPLKDGYVVSGFETPNTQSHFTEPDDLRDEVLGVSPHLHFNFEDDWTDAKNDTEFSQNIDRAIEAVDLLERLAVHFQRERPTRLQVAYLQATDILFHKAWRWCDPKTSGENPVRQNLIRKFFKRIDQMINRVMGLHSSASQVYRTNAPKTLRLIVSDHGHGISKGRVFINTMLKQWGYLVPLGSFGSITRRLKLLTLQADERRVRSRELPVNWKRTKAYLAHVGIYGFIYLNLKGREPFGIVEPEQFEEVRDQLIARFKAEKIPGTNEPLFPHIWKGEELYARKKELNLPDLIVAPADGFYPRKKLGRTAVRVTPKAIGGVHRTEGIYAFEGGGVFPSKQLSARSNIADIAPTLLAALHEPIPRSMTGQVMTHIWGEAPPKFTYSDDTGPKPAAPPSLSGAYTKEEEAEVQKRLADLGYLE